MIDYNVLIIEDDPHDFKMLEERMNEISIELESRSDIRLKVDGIRCWEISHDSFLEFFQKQRIDIVLLDYELTWLNGIQFNGIRVLDKITENVSPPLPYIIYTSGRFETDNNALKGMTYAENGTKFQYHQAPKPQMLDKDLSSNIITKILPYLEKRISLNLIEYPFNVRTHSDAGDYSISALVSGKPPSPKKSGRTPSKYFEGEIIRESEIIAILTPKNGPNGLVYIKNSSIEFAIIDFERSKLNIGNIQGIFNECGIALTKGRSLLFHRQYVQSRLMNGYSILPINGISNEMIEDFMKNKRGREIYNDASHTPFHELFKSLRTI